MKKNFMLSIMLGFMLLLSPAACTPQAEEPETPAIPTQRPTRLHATHRLHR